MIALVVLLLVLGLGLAGLLTAIRQRSGQQWSANLDAYRLRFPRGLKPETVASFAAGLSGLLPPWHRRWFSVTSAIGWEVVSRPDGISHYLLVPPPLAERVLANLRAALPGLSITADPDYRPRPVTAATELTISTTARPLRTDQATALSTALLSSLQPLADDEAVVIQYLLTPCVAPRPLKRPRPHRYQGSWWLLLEQAGHLDSEAFQAARAKQAPPLLWATARVGVVAPTLRPARQRLASVLAVFRLLDAPGVTWRQRLVPEGEVRHRLRDRRLPLVQWPLLLNGDELSELLIVPLGDVSLPGLNLGGCRQLAPSSLIPSSGRVVADATFPGVERPLAISPVDRLRHGYLIGPTGVGKSVLLGNLALQDVADGGGVLLLDGKGDLASDVIDRLPADRLDDVIILDPADGERPLGLNLLSSAGASRGLIAEQVVSVFAHLYKANWGPRSDDILRASVLALLHVPGMTLTELPLLLTNATFRKRLVAQLDDQFLIGFWQWYEGLRPGERNSAIAPVLNKARAFLMRERVRHIIGQADGQLSFEQVLNEGKVLVISLAKGLLGEEASSLLGSLVLMRCWQAVLGRARLPISERRPFSIFVDEFQDYLGAAGTFGELLAQARGLGVGVTVAHQHLAQLPKELRSAVLANCRSKVAFQAGADDARLLAREFAPYLTADDLMGLGPYEVAMSLAVGAHTVAPVTGRTRPMPPSLHSAEVARDRSRIRYGRDRAEVEAAIRARQSVATERGPVRRQRRAS